MYLLVKIFYAIQYFLQNFLIILSSSAAFKTTPSTAIFVLVSDAETRDERGGSESYPTDWSWRWSR